MSNKLAKQTRSVKSRRAPQQAWKGQANIAFSLVYIITMIKVK
ncbi:hypothetical protein [Paenibacillus tyrfis]|nr:hypothetical protein [Paenibacillus tyrfis]